MIKKLFAQGGRAVVAEIPEPELRPGEVLIAPAFSIVSAGTETATIAMSADPAQIHDHDYPAPDGHRFGPQLRAASVAWRGPGPRTAPDEFALIGYSLAGRVVAVGSDVIDLKPGDRVAASGSQCAHHAELVAVPRNLTTRVPDGVALDAAAFITLGTIAMQAVRLTQATFGSTVVMYGLGLLGLLGTQIASAGGIYTVGLDLDERRPGLGPDVAPDGCRARHRERPRAGLRPDRRRRRGHRAVRAEAVLGRSRAAAARARAGCGGRFRRPAAGGGSELGRALRGRRLRQDRLVAAGPLDPQPGSRLEPRVRLLRHPSACRRHRRREGRGATDAAHRPGW